MKKLTTLIFSASIALLLSGCGRYASEKDFDNIVLHMDKKDVIEKMSAKGVARGSITNKFGQVIEVREYQVEKSKTGTQVGGEVALTLLSFGLCAPVLFSNGEIDTYWLYFCEGQLVQWGKAGDWAEAQKIVYDINFNISKKGRR